MCANFNRFPNLALSTGCLRGPVRISRLVSAVERDDVVRLRQLLSSLKDNSEPQRDSTQQYSSDIIMQLAKCLYISSARSHLQCARLLLEAGAQPNIRGDTNGNTPLIIATRAGDADMVSLLVGVAGCDVNKPSYVARSRAIHWAASSSECDSSLECLRVLLERGADVESRVASGRTPLMLAARAGHLQAVKQLLRHGAKVSSTDSDRLTALHLASQEGCVDCVKLLIEHNADSSALTRHGDSPLSLAARYGHDDVVRLLLDIQSSSAAAVSGSKEHHHSSVRQRRLQSPLTPVHWAAAGAHHDCMELLLERAEWRLVADRPTTERRVVGDFSAPAGTTPLMLAARAGSRKVVRQIVESVGDLLVIDRQDEHGMTALLLAVESDHSDCVRELLYAGASPDGRTTIRLDDEPSSTEDFSQSSWQGLSEMLRTPLVVAMLHNSVSSLRLLLQAGCSLYTPSRAIDDDDDEVFLPSDLIIAGRCADAVQRLVTTAASAQGLQICRCHLRRQLSNVARIRGGPTISLLRAVACLPLPPALQRFLLLQELDTVH